VRGEKTNSGKKLLKQVQDKFLNLSETNSENASPEQVPEKLKL